MAVPALSKYASMRHYRSITSCFCNAEVQNIAAIRKIGIFPAAISGKCQRYYHHDHKKTASYLPEEAIHCTTKAVPMFTNSKACTGTYQHTNVDFAATLPERHFSELDFCRADEAFENRATKELFRALIVLKLSSYRVFVDNSLKVSPSGGEGGSLKIGDGERQIDPLLFN